MADKELFGISEQLDCSDCVNHGGDWNCDHVQCRKGADSNKKRLDDWINNLPPAKPEIIRCKDCKWGAQDEVGRWFCRSLGCQIGNEDGSGYCADAERRTDANNNLHV